jgi:hypothetical protein
VNNKKNKTITEFLAALREGKAQANRGEVVPRQQVKLELEKGLGNYTRERHGWLRDKSVQKVAKRIRTRRSTR